MIIMANSKGTVREINNMLNEFAITFAESVEESSPLVECGVRVSMVRSEYRKNKWVATMTVEFEETADEL